MPWFDDFEIGALTDLGQHHFAADAIIGFGQTFDPQPFHVSEVAGKASLFGGLAASGWQTAAIWQSLLARHEADTRLKAVETGMPQPPDTLTPGASDVRWLKPVLSGDTISYRVTIKEKTLSEANPGWGVVVARGEGFNQRGELVFHLDQRRFAKIRA
jgi:acyl dehydratase